MPLKKEYFLNVTEEETCISSNRNVNYIMALTLKQSKVISITCAWLIEGQTRNRCKANLSTVVLKIRMRLRYIFGKAFCESIIQFMTHQ